MDLIEGCDNTVQDEIITRLSSNGRPSKRRKKNDPTSRPETRDRTLCEPAKDKLIERALKRLLQGCNEVSGEHDALLSGSGDGYSLPPESSVTEKPNRQKLAVGHYLWCEKNTTTFEGWRRLGLLCISYEIERLLQTVEREATSTLHTESDVAAAERKFAELSGSRAESIKEMHKRARRYDRWASKENGLGILLMLGTQTRTL